MKRLKVISSDSFTDDNNFEDMVDAWLNDEDVYIHNIQFSATAIGSKAFIIWEPTQEYLSSL